MALRALDDIIRAHDLFVAQLVGDIPILVDQSDLPLLIAATDALCWVLGHEHNLTFADNLKKMRAVMEAYGIDEVVIDLNDPRIQKLRGESGNGGSA